MSESEIFDFQKELLLKNLEMNDAAIKNFDEQTFKIQGWSVLIWMAFIGWAFQKEIKELFYLSILVPVFFWIINAHIKYLQRGYVITSNFLRKKLSDPKYIKEMFEKKSLLELPAFDPGGFYTLKNSPEHKEWYNKRTSFIKAIFLKSMWIFYSSMILFSVLIVIMKFYL